MTVPFFDKYPRAGEPWSTWEEMVLISNFRAGMPEEEICKLHGRAPGGINSRLEQALNGESFRRRGITQKERDELLHQLKCVEQKQEALKVEFYALRNKIYELAK